MSELYSPHFAHEKGAIIDGGDRGILLAVKAGAPTASAAGYAKGCLFIDHTNGVVYENTGTKTSATWSAVGTAASGGAANVGITDSGGFTAQTTVEAALAELYQHLISTQVVVPMSIASFREVDGNKDVGTTSAIGGVLASNTTPALEATATTEHFGIRWVTGNTDNIAISVTLPEDLDDASDVFVDLWVQANTTDQAPTFTVETSWIGAQTLGSVVSDTATAVTSTAVQEITATIASADVPADSDIVTLALIPAAHGTSEFTLYGARLRYKGKLRTS